MSKKKHAESHENHERWLVSYADFITLLFAFFVVMYSVSSVNEGKFRVLSESMMTAFRSPTPNSMKPIQLGGMVGTPSPQAVGQPNMNPGVAPDLRPLPTAIFQRAPRTLQKLAKDYGPAGKPTAPVLTSELADGKAEGDPNLAKVAAKLREHLAKLIHTDLVNVRSSDFWVEVEIKNSILFASGSAIVNPEALAPMAVIAEILREIPNRIQVEGFTDNRPISTPIYPSNWELSAARAANVVHVLMNDGVRPERMAAIGYGEHQPIADNRTEQGRLQNRRVVLVIMGNTDTRYPADFDQASAAPHADRVAENAVAAGKPPKQKLDLIFHTRRDRPMHDVLFHGIAIAALLVGNALLIALGFLAARLLSPAPETEAGREEPQPPSLHQELKGVTLSLAALGERLMKLEVQIGQLREQGGPPGLPLNRDADQKFFKVATKLALQGASVEEVMELCGLSRGEADLICMLHSSNQVSPSSVAGESIRQFTSRVAELRESSPIDGTNP